MSSSPVPLIDADALLRDLDESWGLPSKFYVDPEIYQFDLDAIFRNLITNEALGQRY